MASNTLDFVIRARNEAKQAVKGFVNDMKRAGISTKDIQRNSREAAKATNKLKREADGASRNFRKAERSAFRMSKGMKSAARALGALIGGFGAYQAIRGSVSTALDFNAALAETSTLLKGTPEEMAKLRKETASLVNEFGGNASDQMRGFYQAISAGASSIEDATTVLSQANKLAIGGVTDVTTGVDILTTAVNAYGKEAITAQEASDALFVGMKLGKTTVGELASGLGKVIPMAKAVGVNFQELVALVSTLTTKGISTREAITGVRGVMTAIIKPTSEAAKAAEALGIEFNAAGIKAKGGLLPFLQDVINKTGGSTEALSLLFGNVEGLTPVLSLATGGLEQFNVELDAMKNSAGATDEAYKKMANSLSKRFHDAIALIRDQFRQLGETLLVGLVPAVEGIASVIAGLTAGFKTLYAAASTAADAVRQFVADMIPQSVVNLVSSLGDYFASFGVTLHDLLPVVQAVGAALIVITGAGILGGIATMVLRFGLVGKVLKIILGLLVGSGKAGIIGAVGILKKVIAFAGFAIKRHPIVAMLTLAIGLATKLSGVLDIIQGKAGAAAAAIGKIQNLQQLAVAGATVKKFESEGSGLFGTIFGGDKAAVSGAKAALAKKSAELAGRYIRQGMETLSSTASKATTLAAKKIAEGAARVNKALATFSKPKGGGPGSGEMRPLSEVEAILARLNDTGGGGGGSKTSALKDLLQSLNTEWRTQAETIAMTTEQLDEYNLRQQLIQAAAEDGIRLSEKAIEGILAQKKAYEEAQRSQETFINGMKLGYDQFLQTVQTNMEFAKEFTNQAFSGMSQMITDFVTKGKADFKGFLRSLLGSIAKFVANKMVVNLFGGGKPGQGGTLFGGGGFLSGLFGGGGGGGFFSKLLGGLFGGGRAFGGPVMAGKVYAVNERTPNSEFFVPSSPGHIITRQEARAASSGGGGNQIVVNFNVQTPDADSFRRSQEQIYANLHRALDRATRRNN